MTDLSKELMDSFKSLYELSTRIDERVKNLITRSDTHDTKVSEILFAQKDIEGRIRVLESKIEKNDDSNNQLNMLSSRVQTIEISHTGHSNVWKTVINFVVQLSLILVAAYILYKLGLQAPTTP